ncbi:MAG TPA: very short patch repair endonuclease [Thiobacillaceae bacterium]|nr:very short patch repair endonuclease [Thiobacillaceae bacterium]HNU65038.1 very short patch repair endonuclease [Thiobacillaceae bacterium]
MTDTLSPPERSARMALIRGKDSKPELVVRRLIHRMGYRYRLHQRDLPGCPDIVFPRRRKAIFVHGCFWHRHGKQCPLTRWPKSKIDFWRPKLEANRARDRRNQRELAALGWRCLIVWECEVRDRERLELKIKEFLDDGESA